MTPRAGLVAAIATLIGCLGPGAMAGEADVVTATATRSGDGSWRFEVTVRHGDQGWSHYADAWEVVAPDGTVLATRTLLHPHDAEQPFTRSLSGVEISPAIGLVELRAHDSVHGYGGATVKIDLSE